jgi:hypothetical protein
VPPVRPSIAEQEVPGPEPTRFYRFNEVDVPAEPQGDWSLSPEKLLALGLERIAIEVLIDDRGSLVTCHVIDPPAMADELRAPVEQAICATPMRPAIREGRRVPSSRRIELFLTPEESSTDAAR